MHIPSLAETELDLFGDEGRKQVGKELRERCKGKTEQGTCKESQTGNKPEVEPNKDRKTEAHFFYLFFI